MLQSITFSSGYERTKSFCSTKNFRYTYCTPAHVSGGHDSIIIFCRTTIFTKPILHVTSNMLYSVPSIAQLND